MIVLDASAAISAILTSQATIASVQFFAAPSGAFVAPALLRFELQNTLLRGERRKLIKPGLVDSALSALFAAVELKPTREDEVYFAALLALARAEQLSIFDAAYLELALAESAALASRDGALLAAATRRGAAVYDLR
jgi:predicted nucleic acid-binding protein